MDRSAGDGSAAHRDHTRRSAPLPPPDYPAHQRGALTQSWWAGRWIAALERLIDPGRLGRGRSYARSGRVRGLDVAAGQIGALVVGSRPTPYTSTVRVRLLDEATWERVLDALAGQAIFAAKLLNGEMPENVEEAFAAAGASLFPAASGDLQTSCTCPDWANPCKHVAAVMLLTGDRFDQDPFLMLALRGRSRDAVLEGLHRRRTADASPSAAGAAPDAAPGPAAPDLARFWEAGAPLDLALDFRPPEADGLTTRRLGPPSFAADPAGLLAQLATMQRLIADHAREVALTEKPDAPRPERARQPEP